MQKMFLFTALAAAALLCSCATTSVQPDRADSIVLQKSAAGVDMSVRFLDETALKELHGETNNPFISPPSTLKMNQTLVFEVAASSASAKPENILMQLNTIELQFGRKPEEPVNRFHLANIWERRIEKNDGYRGWNKARLNNVIKEYVLPNTAQAASGERIEGYVVFMGKFPTYGDATLYVPVFDSENMLNNFRFQFTF